MADVLDIDKEAGLVFDATRWIGCGQAYKDVPLYVCKAFTSTCKIPDDVMASYIPSPQVPIIEFINLPLPAQSSELITTRPAAWFSTDPPDKNATQLLLSRTIPPKAHLDKLEAEMGQAWFNGNISIIDHRFNSGRDRLPWWAPTYWQLISKIIRMQTDWKRAKGWIEANAKNIPSHPTPEVVLAAHPWNSPLHRNSCLTTHTLAQLLTDRWLNDDIMLLMIGHLQDRLQQDPVLNASTIIAPSLFYTVIEKAAQRNNFDLPALQRVENQVKYGTQHHLWLGGFIGGNHEIALQIDFEKKQLAYGVLLQSKMIAQKLINTFEGDSLAGSYPPPRALLAAIQKWLRARFNGPFVDQGDSIAHGVQFDASSCLICSANTIAHGVFGDKIWEQSAQAFHRLTWFSTLLQPRIVKVYF
jgi:hypothetical protein